jgi:hypothetical protein
MRTTTARSTARNTYRRTAVLGVSATALTAGLIASPILVASAAGAGTTYYGCVDAKTGSLYSVKSGAASSCKSGDAPISWNSQGPTGATGSSAYQVWLASGKTGTEQDFLAALHGAQGPAGRDGLNGLNGLNGRDGTAGANGANGANGLNGRDGKDAYASWLALGGSGSEADFLASLKGPAGAPGEDGAPGATGPKGDKGDKGDAGAGLPEVWTTTGYAKIETQDATVTPLVLDLPGGVYQLQAKLTPMLYVADVPGHNVLRAHCSLLHTYTLEGNTYRFSVDNTDVQLPVASNLGTMQVTLPLQATRSSYGVPARFSVNCYGDAHVQIAGGVLTATRVTDNS